MKKYILILLLCTGLVIAAEPPVLTDFQIFHGVVNDLPNGTYALKATVGGNIHTSTVGVDGKYGAEVFKVYGENGQEINFTVVNPLGVATQVGTATYSNQAITSLNLQYPVVVPEDADEDQEESEEDASDDSQEDTPNVQTCTMNWQCGGWSACRGTERRTCVRIDNCGADAVTIPKPAESRSCTAGTPAQACSPNLKRCLGSTVQQCAPDGSVWNTVESCPAGCNAATFSCNVVTAEPETQKAETPGYILPLIGSIILLIVIGLLVYFHRKKGGGGNSYVSSARNKGFSDTQIKSKLSNQGWNAEQIQKAMK